MNNRYEVILSARCDNYQIIETDSGAIHHIAYKSIHDARHTCHGLNQGLVRFLPIIHLTRINNNSKLRNH